MKHFITFCLTAFSMILTYQISVAEHDSAPRAVYNDAGYEIDGERQDLRKRAVLTPLFRGMAAADKLLTGARKFRTTKKSRSYKKIGNRQTALEDFYSVEPQIRKWELRGRAVDVYIGTVGDRRLILMLDGDRLSKPAPVLEIRSATDVLYDRIVYKTE